MPNIEDTRGPFIRTVSGGKYYPLDPRPEDFNLEDIAHGLSRQARFNGHTSPDLEPYSVAQHAVLVSLHVPKKYAMDALHHDDSEAFHGDMPSPIKHIPEMSVFRSVENATMDAIKRRFNLLPFEPAEVKIADMRCLITEIRDLQGYKSTRYNRRPFKEKIVPLPWREARDLFLTRHREIINERSRDGASQDTGTENQSRTTSSRRG